MEKKIRWATSPIMAHQRHKTPTSTSTKPQAMSPLDSGELFRVQKQDDGRLRIQYRATKDGDPVPPNPDTTPRITIRGITRR